MLHPRRLVDFSANIEYIGEMICRQSMTLAAFNEHFFVVDGIIYHRTKKSRMPAGSKAGYTSKSGYCRISHNSTSYMAHRILYQYYNEIHDLCPSVQIDHVDGNPRNNSKENLREATVRQNVCNSRMRVDNRAGVKGLSEYTYRKGCRAEKTYWRGRIKLDGEELSCRFPHTDEGRQQAIDWLAETRLRLHGSFAKQ